MKITDAICEGSSCLGRAYFELKERDSVLLVAKAIATYVIALLTSPLWGVVLAGAWLYDRQEVNKQISLGWRAGTCQLVSRPIPQTAPVDSHFTRHHSKRLGKRLFNTSPLP